MPQIWGCKGPPSYIYRVFGWELLKILFFNLNSNRELQYLLWYCTMYIPLPPTPPPFWSLLKLPSEIFIKRVQYSICTLFRGQFFIKKKWKMSCLDYDILSQFAPATMKIIAFFYKQIFIEYFFIRSLFFLVCALYECAFNHCDVFCTYVQKHNYSRKAYS